MGIRSLAVLSFVGVLGVASVASADGWKGPISQWLNSNNQNSSNATVQNNTTLPNGDNRSVPVPGTLALFAGGFGLFAAWHRRTRQQ